MASDELILESLEGLELAVEEEGEALEGEEEEDINPVLPEVHEILWPALFFVLLWVLMKHVLLPPVRRVVEARAGKLSADTDATDAARAELGQVEREYHDLLANAVRQADGIVAAAREEAETHRREQVHAAEAEITAQRLELDEEIRAARDTALATLRPHVTTLAVGAASRVLDRRLDETDYSAVVEQALADGS